MRVSKESAIFVVDKKEPLKSTPLKEQVEKENNKNIPNFKLIQK